MPYSHYTSVKQPKYYSCALYADSANMVINSMLPKGLTKAEKECPPASLENSSYKPI